MISLLAVALALSGAQEKSTAPLGSASFKPSPDRPVGWRGDGSGRFPGATPPLQWARTKDGNGYSAKNILWATPLTDSGVSSPIVAGGRIFLTAGYSDLICIEAQSGRILWIRTNTEIESLTEEERKADPAFAEKQEPLLAKLQQANADAVEALNAMHGGALTAPYKAPEVLARKKAIEKQLRDGIQAIDRKKFGLNWAQVIYGYSTETPATDGRMVCALFGTGVAVGYDLNGNRKWIARGAIGGEEKGHYASPVIVGKQFVVWGDPEIRGYDVETGKLLWKNPAKGSNAGSLFRFRAANGDWIAGLQTSLFVRVRDGAPIWKGPELNYSFTTSIVEGDTLFAWAAGPKKDLKAWSIPPGTDSGQLKPRLTFKPPEWGADELAGKFEKGDVNASPLYVDGLLYNLYPGGGLVVHDAASGEVVYRKVLPMRARTEYWGWGGASSSPALAGKNLYLIDNQGTTVVIAPGRVYKELAVNRIDEQHDGKTQVQNLANPWFDGSRLYFRTAGHLYCIGER